MEEQTIILLGNILLLLIGTTHSVNGQNGQMALMVHLLVETVSEEVSEDPLKEA
jgi:hypothetical protein